MGKLFVEVNLKKDVDTNANTGAPSQRCHVRLLEQFTILRPKSKK